MPLQHCPNMMPGFGPRAAGQRDWIPRSGCRAWSPQQLPLQPLPGALLRPLPLPLPGALPRPLPLPLPLCLPGALPLPLPRPQPGPLLLRLPRPPPRPLQRPLPCQLPRHGRPGGHDEWQAFPPWLCPCTSSCPTITLICTVHARQHECGVCGFDLISNDERRAYSSGCTGMM